MIKVFIESGKRKTFAGAVDWPGWCRWGKNDVTALDSLLEYGGRYAVVMQSARIDFQAPTDISAFAVTERHKGNVTTDFGAHDIPLDADHVPVSQDELVLWVRILQGSWASFDHSVVDARGKTLRKGPRGGGRDLEKIMLHVLQADQAYLRRVAWRVSKRETKELPAEFEETREMILQALDVAVHQGLPEGGPRGGKIWPARFFVRRVVWHVLDHAWEIEDRVE